MAPALEAESITYSRIAHKMVFDDYRDSPFDDDRLGIVSTARDDATGLQVFPDSQKTMTPVVSTQYPNRIVKAQYYDGTTLVSDPLTLDLQTIMGKDYVVSNAYRALWIDVFRLRNHFHMLTVGIEGGTPGYRIEGHDHKPNIAEVHEFYCQLDEDQPEKYAEIFWLKNGEEDPDIIDWFATGNGFAGAPQIGSPRAGGITPSAVIVKGTGQNTGYCVLRDYWYVSATRIKIEYTVWNIRDTHMQQIG